MARSAHYKSVSVRKGNNQRMGKQYNAPVDKGKQRAVDEKNPSG